jgi:hypothetical protein
MPPRVSGSAEVASTTSTPELTPGSHVLGAPVGGAQHMGTTDQGPHGRRTDRTCQPVVGSSGIRPLEPTELGLRTGGGGELDRDTADDLHDVRTSGLFVNGQYVLVEERRA